MIDSLLDLVRFVERSGVRHLVRTDSACIDLTTDEGRLTLCWDRPRGRVFAIRWDDEDARPALRLSVPMAAGGGIAEDAIVRLLTAAMPRSAHRLTLEATLRG